MQEQLFISRNNFEPNGVKSHYFWEDLHSFTINYLQE